MVPLERIEPSTSPLPRVCSTTEPQRRMKRFEKISKYLWEHCHMQSFVASRIKTTPSFLALFFKYPMAKPIVCR